MPGIPDPKGSHGNDSMLRPHNASRTAKTFGVPEHEVLKMGQRMAVPGASLNVPIEADDVSEWQDGLVDDSEDQETLLADSEETARRNSLLPPALERLTTRKRQIADERHLYKTLTTLEDLSQDFRVSSERTRQIKMRAMTKLKRSLLAPTDWQPSDYPETAVADVRPRRALALARRLDA